MNFEAYWKRLEAANASLANSDRMTISVAAFRAMMEKSWHDGFGSGKVIGRAAAKAAAGDTSEVQDIFEMLKKGR